MSSEEMAKYNAKNVGHSFVVSSGSKSHFMCGETLAVMMEQLLSPALELQRQRQLGP